MRGAVILLLAVVHAELSHHEPPSPPSSPGDLHGSTAADLGSGEDHGSTGEHSGSHSSAHGTTTVCHTVSHDYCSEEHEEEHTDPIDYILFPMSALLVSVLTQMVCSKLRLNVPVTVVLFVYGLVLGQITAADDGRNFALSEATSSPSEVPAARR